MSIIHDALKKAEKDRQTEAEGRMVSNVPASAKKGKGLFGNFRRLLIISSSVIVVFVIFVIFYVVRTPTNKSTENLIAQKIQKDQEEVNIQKEKGLSAISASIEITPQEIKEQRSPEKNLLVAKKVSKITPEDNLPISKGNALISNEDREKSEVGPEQGRELSKSESEPVPKSKARIQEPNPRQDMSSERAGISVSKSSPEVGETAKGKAETVKRAEFIKSPIPRGKASSLSERQVAVKPDVTKKEEERREIVPSEPSKSSTAAKTSEQKPEAEGKDETGVIQRISAKKRKMKLAEEQKTTKQPSEISMGKPEGIGRKKEQKTVSEKNLSKETATSSKKSRAKVEKDIMPQKSSKIGKSVGKKEQDVITRKVAKKTSESSSAVSKQMTSPSRKIAVKSKVEVGSSELTKGKDANKYYNRAVLFEHDGKIQEALRNYKKAIEIDPTHIRAHNGLGNIYLRLLEYSSAKKEFQLVLMLDPNDSKARNNLGLVYLRMNEYIKALGEFRKAIDSSPTNIAAYNNLGITYKKLKRYNEALEHFNRAIFLDEKYAQAYYGRATVLESLGRIQEAIIDYRKFIEYAPASLKRQVIKVQDHILDLYESPARFY